MASLLALSYVTALLLAVRGMAMRIEPDVRARLGVESGGGGPALLSGVGRRAPSRLRRRIGASTGLAPADLERLLGAKLSLGALGIVLAALAGTTPAQRVVLGVILGAGGFTLPSFQLARRATARSRAMRVAVPDALDVIAVAVSAGLTPRLALERAADAVGDPLASELSQARRDVALGVPWLAALRALAARSGLEELRRLAATLSRSERLGSPIADRLRTLARDVRAERRAEAEERARRAPVAMLFPLVFLILPAFVLTAVVPAVLVATRGIP